MNLTFDQLQQASAQRANSNAFKHGLRDWLLTQWTNALAGETGELCNFAKKVERDGKNYDAEMGEELADIIIYSVIVAEYVGIKLHDDFKSLRELAVETEDLRSDHLTTWTNKLAARTGFLCALSSNRREDVEEFREFLVEIIAHCAIISEYIGLNLGNEVRKKFNRVSDKRGVDIKI